MAKKRDNCIILLVNAPEPSGQDTDFKTAFDQEREARLGGDLLAGTYKFIKAYGDAMVFISYEKTPRYPDLTWLDQEDPGFLEVKNRTREERIQDAFRMAFFTGSSKVMLLDNLSQEVKKEWLTLAFESVSDKTVAIGSNQDGSFYMLALTQQNLKILEAPGFSQGKSAETLAERAKKNKLTVFSTPETYAAKDEATPPPPAPAPQPVQPPESESKKRHKRHGADPEPPAQQTPAEKPPL